MLEMWSSIMWNMEVIDLFFLLKIEFISRLSGERDYAYVQIMHIM